MELLRLNGLRLLRFYFDLGLSLLLGKQSSVGHELSSINWYKRFALRLSNQLRVNHRLSG